MAQQRSRALCHHTWLVVGAGPCGVMAAGCIVDHLRLAPASSCTTRRHEHEVRPRASLCWVDPAFEVGRLGRYTAVASNSGLAGTAASRHAVPSLEYGVSQRARMSAGQRCIAGELARGETHGLLQLEVPVPAGGGLPP